MKNHSAGSPSSFNDEWFYEELMEFDLEKSLDLSSWYESENGPRWRAMAQKVWSPSPERTEWRDLIERLPSYFGSEVAYLADRTLTFAGRMHPDLDTILANHAYTEWLLYSEMDYSQYRDHIVHPFKVGMLAWWLLEKGAKDARNEILRNLSEASHVQRLLRHLGLTREIFSVSNQDSYRILNAAIWIAALFHDLGYGHNFMCGLEKRLCSSFGFYAGDVVGGSITGMNPDLMEKSLIVHHLDIHSTREDVNTGRWRNNSWPPNKERWQTSLFANLTRNHSIAGAMNLLCICQEIVDNWPDVDPRLVLVFELAAEAIFLHDLTGKDSFSEPNFEITFKESPLAVVLILADEMQCWGRPVLRYRRADDDQETITRFCSEHEELSYRLEDKNDKQTLYLDTHVFVKLQKMRDELKRLDWEGLVEIEELK